MNMQMSEIELSKFLRNIILNIKNKLFFNRKYEIIIESSLPEKLSNYLPLDIYFFTVF